ncbi:hypothetical protein [Corynebacterium ulcerans]|uniref:hypothetical protein n=1 Tax=Corynebacterium ulcerans TaxID=65058 RepID=UPI0003C7D21A|nr:hypothetical protein [Corynebacterium ulcerans]ESU57457.1 hypothetical protein D881_10735 [Corynebacterium ulcerans NCTC 12077]STC82272.1 Uncharacterised protein [Corynebacterium ulcerans]
MTPEEASELLKGTTPGPWEADSYTYQLADCPEATDFWVSSESSFIAGNDNRVGDERVSAAGNNFELIAVAPVLAETIAGMQAEYAVQVQSSGEWYYLNEHGDWLIAPAPCAVVLVCPGCPHAHPAFAKRKIPHRPQVRHRYRSNGGSMNNLERAEQVMSEYVDSVGGLTNLDEEYCGVLDGLAEALADAGLLMPDLPEVSSRNGQAGLYGVEYVKDSSVFVESSGAIYLEGVNYTSGEGDAVFANPDDARKAALALWAVVDKRQRGKIK